MNRKIKAAHRKRDVARQVAIDTARQYVGLKEAAKKTLDWHFATHESSKTVFAFYERELKRLLGENTKEIIPFKLREWIQIIPIGWLRNLFSKWRMYRLKNATKERKPVTLPIENGLMQARNLALLATVRMELSYGTKLTPAEIAKSIGVDESEVVHALEVIRLSKSEIKTEAPEIETT